ncbi:serine carboxypeptidase S28-domain-containing protein [Biscogniauxia marginata]|nr:serine carboxypeptidase S28-domain-containing protein [Biscogniauxia marginata]
MGLKAIFLVGATVMASGLLSQGEHIAGNGEIQEFTQRLNHSINDTSRSTFSQRYQLDTQHFKPGGPIFFIQSAETGMSLINSSDFADYASKLGGMVAMLEHRFFSNTSGNSYSTHMTVRDDTSSSNKTFPDLTIDNVLQDGVNFVDWIKSTVEGANDSKVIYGGSSSYGGFLAVSARIRRPGTFWGAIASSPALNSFGPLDTNTFRFDAADRTDIIYQNMSSNAYDKIKSAMSTFDECLSDNNCPEVVPDLDICADSKDANYTILYHAALQTYTLTPQFNYPYIDRYSTENPFQDLIAKTLAANTTGEVLRVPLLAASWSPSTACIDLSNANITDPSIASGTVPMYDYVSCALFPLNTLSIPSGNMLPEAHARGTVDLCDGHADWEPVDYYRANEYFVQKYVVTNAAVDRAERLLIVQGGFDRTAAVGSPALTVTRALNHSRVVLVDGLAHAEDAFSEAVEPRGTKAQLDQVSEINKFFPFSFFLFFFLPSSFFFFRLLLRDGPVRRAKRKMLLTRTRYIDKRRQAGAY